jgi:predicted DNA-binding ribbon-helix-helix protein
MCEIFASQPQDSYEPITRNIRLNGQSTSIRLERSFWVIIDAMAKEEGVSTPTFLSTLHSEVLEIHGEAKNFTSLLRCSCVKKMQLITLSTSSNLSVRSSATNERLKKIFP